MFGGGGSIKLVNVFGIRIGVEPSWFVVLFLVIWSLSGYYGDLFPDGGSTAFILAVVSALAFFGSVLLHELGHAVVALRNGIGIVGIDLWLFGGVAKMKRDTDSAGVEFRVAAAGPFVTLLIAVAGFGAAALVAGAGSAFDSARFEASRSDEALAVLSWIGVVNVTLLLFNLLPGFPLDGGRIVRALVWWRTGDRTRATRVAARMGQGVAYLMIAVGLYLIVVEDLLITGIWLGVVGLFLGQAAKATEAQSAVTGRIEGVVVADVMDDEPVAAPGDLSLDRAHDELFLRYRAPWFPVIDADGRLTGLVTREAVEAVPEEQRPQRTVATVMAADASTERSDLRIGVEEPLESLLGRDGLQRLGALMAVDGEGRLRGIVTLDQVARALRPIAPG